MCVAYNLLASALLVARPFEISSMNRINKWIPLVSMMGPSTSEARDSLDGDRARMTLTIKKLRLVLSSMSKLGDFTAGL